ncbi:hypothetical protein KAR34_04690 [bacterium]|nr:hypothetical protein [bacterium]
MTKYYFCCLGVCVAIFVLFLLNISAASWQQDGEYLNLNSNQGAGYSTIAVKNNTPYVTWSESNGAVIHVYVKHYNNGVWVQDGGSLNVDPTQHAQSAKITIIDNTPYVTWHESNDSWKKIYVKRLNGMSWELVGSGYLNLDTNYIAISPSISSFQATPYVTWCERNAANRGQILVKYFIGSAWTQLGPGSLNVDSSQEAQLPDIVLVDATPYVAWCENTAAYSTQIYVKYYNGNTWIQEGGTLNIDPGGGGWSPTIIANQLTPYVAWYEGNSKVYVKHLNGAGWVQDGGCMNISPTEIGRFPELNVTNGKLYITWGEILGKEYVFVKSFNGSNWVQEGNALNIDTNYHAFYPSIASAVDGTIYVSWHEQNATGYDKVYVKHLRNSIPTMVFPNHSLPDRSLQLRIGGIQFINPLLVQLVRNGSVEMITGQNIQVLNENSIIANFDLSGAIPGAYDLRILRNQQYEEINRGFWVLAGNMTPLRWVVTDMAGLDSSIMAGIFSGVACGDGDNDNEEEIFSVCRNQKIFRSKKSDFSWMTAPVHTNSVVGEYYSHVLVCDGNQDEKQEVYVATVDNHVYEFSSLDNWQKNEVSSFT